VEYTTTKPPQECLEKAWGHKTRGDWKHPGTVNKSSGAVQFRGPDRWHGCLANLFTLGLINLMGKDPGFTATLTASTWSDGLTHITVTGDEAGLVRSLDAWTREGLGATPVS
jgi:hypothetical protein